MLTLPYIYDLIYKRLLHKQCLILWQTDMPPILQTQFSCNFKKFTEDFIFYNGKFHSLYTMLTYFFGHPVLRYEQNNVFTAYCKSSWLH